MIQTTPSKLHQRYHIVRQLIWIYLILLIGEGALRKWILPSLSNPLLVIRDPIVIAIYMVTLRLKCFPVNGFVSGCLIMAFFSFFFGILSHNSNLLITLYGLRVNYLHIPLLFVVPIVMNREDVYNIGKFLLYISIPMTVLEVLQFYSPQEHWLNARPGGIEGESLVGGKGRLRASGTFSFIQGMSAFYPMVMAFLISFIVEKRKASIWFISAVGISTVVAIPCSISRTLALTCGIVLVAAALSLYFKKDTSKLFFKIALALCTMAFLASFLPFFDEGVESFEDRWVSATGTTQKEFNTNITQRFLGGFSQSSDFFNQIRLTGLGIGMGTNVAAKMLTGSLGFMLAEDEWPKIILELGPLLGSAFIFFRILLTFFVLRSAFLSMRRGNILPMLLAASIGLLILNGQWGPPTILGFAILGGGLSLAACNPPHETLLQKNIRRHYANTFMHPIKPNNALPPWQRPTKTIG